MREKTTNDQTREIKVSTKPTAKKRGHWYLLTGLLIGAAAGLVFSWLIFPVVYQDTTPATLAEGYKEIYRRTIAEVYAATGDLDRAISRIRLLEDEDIVNSLGAQAQRALAEGREREAKALALLASAVQSRSFSGESIPLLITPSVTPGEPALPTQTLPQFSPEP